MSVWLTDILCHCKDYRFKGLIFLLSRLCLFILVTHVIFCLSAEHICGIDSVSLMGNGCVLGFYMFLYCILSECEDSKFLINTPAVLQSC